MTNLVNVPMVTSATFRKIASAKSKAVSKPSGQNSEKNKGLVDRILEVAASKTSSGGVSSASTEVKPADVLSEEAKTFDDSIKSLDGEESRPKTVLDDVLTCLSTSHQIVLEIYNKRKLNVDENASLVTCLALQ